MANRGFQNRSNTFGGNSKDGFVTIDVIDMSAGIPAELLTTR
jgi:hypothetical protein